MYQGLFIVHHRGAALPVVVSQEIDRRGALVAAEPRRMAPIRCARPVERFKRNQKAYEYIARVKGQ